MNTKRAAIAIVFFILLALVIYGWQKQQVFEPVDTNQPLVKNLSKNVNDIALIEIEKQGVILSIEKKENQWLLRQKDNYPVDTSKVRTLLLQLAESSLLEEKTSNPALYEKLGLDAESRAKVQAYLDLEKSETLFSLDIGHTNGTIGTYIVGGDRPQSWLTSGVINVDSDLNDWLQTELFNIEEKDITQITIQNAEKQRVVLKADEFGGFVLEGLATGQESDPARISSITSSFRMLNFQQVENESSKDLSAGITSEIITSDGMLITALVLHEDGQYWAKFEVSASLDKVQVDNTADTAESLFAITQKRVDQLKEKLSSRVFLLYEATGEALSSQKKDLIKKAAVEETKR